MSRKKGTRDMYRQQAIEVLALFEAGMRQSDIARKIDTYRERIRAMINNGRRYRAEQQQAAE